MPEEKNLRLILAQIALRQEDFSAFHEHFAIVLKNAQDQDKPMIMVVKARLLLEEEESEKAPQVLVEARVAYPDLIDDGVVAQEWLWFAGVSSSEDAPLFFFVQYNLHWIIWPMADWV